MFSLFKMFMKPIEDVVDFVTTPIAVQSAGSTQNMEHITTMFNALNTTAQTMIEMNVSYLETTRRLSDDIGTMADRIGLMADKIEETEVLQSNNFISVLTNTTPTVAPITDSTVFTIMTSNVISSMEIPLLPVENTIDGAAFAAQLFQLAPNSNAALLASMFISFSETMNSMINMNADYINTTIKLGNDVGKMTMRIGQMADKIVDTMVIQGNNLEALQGGGTAANANTTLTAQTVDTSVSAPHIESSLSASATNVTNSVLDMTSSFATMMETVANEATSNENGVNGIVGMFNAANNIVREMITLNTQFLTTVTSLSDEIGAMADNIGDMADQIVAMQKVFSPLYLSTHDVDGSSVDASEASLIALNGSMHVGTDSMNIFLSSIESVSEASSLAMPISMQTIGDMTAMFISILKGLANADMGTVNMDDITAMFATSNETIQMMMDMNDQYMTAVLKLSDDIGLMSDRILVMADRIIETQEIQSENFLATYHDATSLMLIGDLGINTLNGGIGADTLDGKIGADKMIGGTGNDTYYVDNIGDVVTETTTSSSEVDTVNSTISYTLSSNVEKLTLIGTANVNGTGNSLNNTIAGNTAANVLNGATGNDTIDGGAGSDSINGGTGNDTLTGGAGQDTFVFNTAINSFSNKDTISDFISGTDKIALDNAIFTKFAVGTLNANNFESNWLGAMNDFNDYLTYNTTTGVLSYDADGIGMFYGQVQIAVLGNAPTISVNDIVII